MKIELNIRRVALAVVLLCTHILLYNTNIHAQVLKDEKFEKEIDSKDEHIRVIPWKNKVMVLYTELNNNTGEDEKNKSLIIECYNEHLKKEWQKEYTSEKKFAIGKCKVIDSSLYIYIKTRRFIGDDENKVTILNISFKGDLKVIEKQIPEKYAECKLESIDFGKDKLFIGGATKSISANEIGSIGKKSLYNKTDPALPVILMGNMENKNDLVEIKTGEYKGFAAVYSISYDPKSNITTALIVDKNREEYTNNILQIDKDCSIINKTEIEGAKNYQFRGFHTFKLNDGSSLVAGDYYTDRAVIQQQIKRGNGFTLQGVNTGIYAVKVLSQKSAQMLYPYARLKNFFASFDTSIQNRIKEKEEMANKEGSDLGFSFFIITHDLFEFNGQIFLIGDVEIQLTHSSGPAGHERTVLDGFQYGYSCVLAFDYSGKLLWDNSFELNFERLIPGKRVASKVYDNKLILAYARGGKINTMVITGKENTIKHVRNESNTAEKEEKDVRYEQNVENWYDNFFISYGIKKKEEGKGVIFYMNKISSE